MNKKGIVMELKKDRAGILTSSGEFVYIKLPQNMVALGQCIEGSLIEDNNKTIIKRLSALVASLLFIVFLSGGLFIYNQPVSAVTISINPAIKLNLNRWKRIISTDFINEDGKKVLSNLKLKNLNVEKGLNLIIEESKRENFINESYIASSKTISIETEGNIKSFNIDNVKDLLEKDGLKYMIKNGEETKTNVEAIIKDTKPTESKDQPNSKVDNNTNGENTTKDDNKKQTNEINQNNKENIDKPNNPSNKPNENTNTNSNTNNENKSNVKANENSNKNSNQDNKTKPENKNNSTGETKQNNNNKEKKKP